VPGGVGFLNGLEQLCPALAGFLDEGEAPRLDSFEASELVAIQSGRAGGETFQGCSAGGEGVFGVFVQGCGERGGGALQFIEQNSGKCHVQRSWRP
jgi:hypothetical protein